MTLHDAILHLEHKVAQPSSFSCVECYQEHQQLLKWLKELEMTREALNNIAEERNRIRRS